VVFLTILIIPLIIILGSFIISQIIKNKKIQNDSLPYRSLIIKEITGKEFLVQFAIMVIITAILTLILSFQNLTYTEVWNGHVVGKERKKVSCRHSYDCNCREVCRGRGRSRSCRTVCDTCHEHSYDVDWKIYDNTGKIFNVEKEDRRGLIMPEFWARTKSGDPTSHTHSYKNYIKASSNSLFRKQGLLEKYKDVLPKYPNKIYDYYKLDRIITVGYSLPDIAKWNKELSLVNATVGVARQCNAIIVIVQEQPREYLYALEQYWLGGNKNDAILVISVRPDGNIIWADIIALVQDSMFKVRLRDGIQEIENIKYTDRIIKHFYKNIMVHFKRKEMKNFEYLTATITPTITQYVIVIIINVIIATGLSILFHREDIF
jgi:hypothetical protein